MIEKLHELIDNKIKVGVLSAKLSSLREPMMIVIICGVIALQVTVFKSTLSSVLIILVLFYRAMGYIMNFNRLGIVFKFHWRIGKYSKF